MGNPFCHIELSTSDVDKAKRFYGDLFDWKLSAMPGGMPYTMINVGKGVGGGMQGLQMADQPTSWLAYVEVSDVEKTLAKAGKAGATIIVPRMQIGEGMGAIGVFKDPQGAFLGVWEAGKKSAPKKGAKKADAKKADGKKAAKADGKKAAKADSKKAAKADGKKAEKKASPKKK